MAPGAIYVDMNVNQIPGTQLVVSADGKELTGELTGDIVHAERKAFLLQQIADENGIPLHQVRPTLTNTLMHALCI